MKTYFTNEINFEVPDEWIQNSINIFPNLKVFGKDFSLVINRDQLDDKQNLDAYVEEQISKQLGLLPDFKLFKKNNIEVSNITSCCVHFQWKDNDGLKVQYQVYIPITNQYFIIITATALEKFTTQHEDIFNNILSTLKFSKGIV